VSKEGGHARDSLEAVWLHHISARASRDRDARTPARSPSADLLANRTPRPGLTALVASFSTADTTMVRDRNKGQYEVLDGCSPVSYCAGGMYGEGTVRYGMSIEHPRPWILVLNTYSPWSHAHRCRLGLCQNVVHGRDVPSKRQRSAGRSLGKAVVPRGTAQDAQGDG
jgi:hypothetical protein